MSDLGSANSPVRILIVDDEEKNLTALEGILDAPDYVLVKAGCGDEALRAVRDQDFAVIVLDVQMPEMNGFEVARLIKQRRKTQHIPILFLSAHYQAEEDALSGYGVGAVDYLTKPFNPAVLGSKVAVFAELYRKSRALEAEVAERRQAEARVRELNEQLATRVRELAQANTEMESFSYTVSHDLRAPLRQVAGFSALLERTLSGNLDAEAAELLQLLQRSTRRMGQLIDDLLAFSQAGRTALQPEAVDLRHLVDQAIEVLQPAMAERAIEWRIDALPQVCGDSRLLRQVWVNLLDNAIKFTRQRDPALIDIGTSAQAGRPVVYVRDNGAGFDSRHADKIFGVFQRLHTEGEFEGTGIGLALTHRIIARHGGSIWAESAEGQGTTLYFSLPPASRPS